MASPGGRRSPVDAPLPPREATPLATTPLVGPASPVVPSTPPADAAASDSAAARRLAGVSGKLGLLVKERREAALQQQQQRQRELVEQMGTSLAEMRAELMTQLAERSDLEREIAEMRATWNPTPFLAQARVRARVRVGVRLRLRVRG